MPETPDDDRVIGPWLTREGSAWKWDEGPCPCGGIMRRPAAGSRGHWHRVCDRCGSHYEIYPIVIHVGPEGELSLPQLPSPEAAERAKRLLEEIRPSDLTEQVRHAGAIYGGWAVRTADQD